MKLDVSQRLDHTEEYYFSRKLREIEQLNLQGPRVINLGIGSPDLPPDPLVIRKLAEIAERPDSHAYQSYKGVAALRNGMAKFYAKYYGVRLDPDSEILPLMGSKEGIFHISMTFLDPGDIVLVPDPGYPSYQAATRLAGASCRSYDLRESHHWLPDLEALAAQDLRGVKLIWVNYPHMPSGAQAPDEFFRKLVAFGRDHGILVCHDNPYSFILNDHPASILQVEGSRDIALELNSLSKSHNMAGWRIGMLCGRGEWVREVLRFKSNLDSGMFLPLQLAAAEALELGEEWFGELNAVYRARRTKIFELLDLLDCRYDTGQSGLFVWASLPFGIRDAYRFSEEILVRARVFLTPGGIFGKNGLDYIRVSLCQPEELITEAIGRISGMKSLISGREQETGIHGEPTKPTERSGI